MIIIDSQGQSQGGLGPRLGTNLKKLNLDHIPQLTDKVSSDLTLRCPNLEELSLYIRILGRCHFSLLV
jgi:hypothetical protein